jgi:hypothetical protein
LKLILLASLLLTACSKTDPVKPPPVDPTTEACKAEKIDCKDFFAFEPGSVQLSYLELLVQWNKSKQLYIGGRPGLTAAEIQTITNLKLGMSGLFIVHGWAPTAMRHITSLDGHETDINLIQMPGWPSAVQGNFNTAPYPWIDYGNPWCLPCEYFHLFELILRGGAFRSPELATPDADKVFQIIGHCTPDDPMNFCCWSSTAYDVPAGR